MNQPRAEDQIPQQRKKTATEKFEPKYGDMVLACDIDYETESSRQRLFLDKSADHYMCLDVSCALADYEAMLPSVKQRHRVAWRYCKPINRPPREKSIGEGAEKPLGILFKYGDKVLVRDSTEASYVDAIFVANDGNYFIVASDKGALINYEKENMYEKKKHIQFWKYCKPFKESEHDIIKYTLETFPLNNSGMIREKSWGKISHTTRYDVDGGGLSIAYEKVSTTRFTWKQASEKLEWLQKDGTVIPFGVVNK